MNANSSSLLSINGSGLFPLIGPNFPKKSVRFELPIKTRPKRRNNSTQVDMDQEYPTAEYRDKYIKKIQSQEKLITSLNLKILELELTLQKFRDRINQYKNDQKKITQSVNRLYNITLGPVSK